MGKSKGKFLSELGVINILGLWYLFKAYHKTCDFVTICYYMLNML